MSGDPGFEAILDALNHELRRDIVDYLHIHGSQPLDELAEAIIGRDDARSNRLRIQGQLQWTLGEADIVDWSGPEDFVMPGPAFETAVAMLHGARDGYAETTEPDGGEAVRTDGGRR